MFGALGLWAMMGSILLFPVMAYTSPFKIKPPDVRFNISIPAISPFITYHGNWSDGGPTGAPTLSGPGNMSCYVAGMAGHIYTHVAGPSGTVDGQQPASLLANKRINGTSLGDGRWEHSFHTPNLSFTFALMDSVNRPTEFDQVVIETGMYTEVESFDDVHCQTDAFVRNASLDMQFTGQWTWDLGSPQAWGGSVVVSMPRNTSYVWINGTTVPGNDGSNLLSIFVSKGIPPLNFQQTNMDTRRSYQAEDLLFYQAPLDPKDEYEFTISSPAMSLIKLNSITYCSYFKNGELPGPGRKRKLVGGLVGGIVGGVLGLVLLGTALWCYFRKKRRHRSRVTSPVAFVVDESASADGIPYVQQPKRVLGSVSTIAGLPRSSSPTNLNGQRDSGSDNLKAATLARMDGSQDRSNDGSWDWSRDQSQDHSQGPLRGRSTDASQDRTMSGSSYDSTMTSTRSHSYSNPSTSNKDQEEAMGSGRPRRQRRYRHIVEIAEDGGAVPQEGPEEVVVEMLPPRYQPEWEERHNPSQ